MSRDLSLSPRSSGVAPTGGDAGRKPRRQAATSPDKPERERAKKPTGATRPAASRQQRDTESGSNEGVVYSYFVRARIRDAQQQAHSIVIERIRSSKAANAQVAASYGGLAAEVTSLALARRIGTGKDRRAALLAIAASAVILAEREDRPAEPKRGAKSPHGAKFQGYGDAPVPKRKGSGSGIKSESPGFAVPDLDAA